MSAVTLLSFVGRLTTALGLLLSAAAEGSSQKTPAVNGKGADLSAILQSAGAYLDGYERQFSAIVSEESYAQSFRSLATVYWADASEHLVPVSNEKVRLRSDLTVINLTGGNWVAYRDVFEVDGHQVRDRQQRVLELLLHPAPDVLVQAQRIADEGARYNIGDAKRTINVPTLALAFLRRDNQPRSSFSLETNAGTLGTVVLRFAEQARPRMIVSFDDAPAAGRFWIEIGSGRVLQTELTLRSAGAVATVSVVYAVQGKVGLWLPVSMVEAYDLTLPQPDYAAALREHIDGRATYTNFRKATVDVNTIIKERS